MRYLYLHGLASGPASAKAKYLRDRFRSRGLTLTLLDFNQDDFFHLTLSRQIEQVEQAIAEQQAIADTQITLIGSSFGGLTAAWVAQRQPSVARLVLLAPAFEFLPTWLRIIGPKQVRLWEQMGEIPIYHHAYRRMEQLNYGIIPDLKCYQDVELTRAIPTTILHGKADETIPIEASRRYQQSRSWVELIELDSDHGLGNSVSRIWRRIQQVCELSDVGLESCSDESQSDEP